MQIHEPETVKVDGNDLTASFIVNTGWDDLPDPVQRKIRMCLLDNVGATLAGTLTRVSRITAEYAAQAWAGDQATILLHGKRATAVGAAFANAWAANGIDVDDCALHTKGHPGA